MDTVPNGETYRYDINLTITDEDPIQTYSTIYLTQLVCSKWAEGQIDASLIGSLPTESELPPALRNGRLPYDYNRASCGSPCAQQSTCAGAGDCIYCVDGTCQSDPTKLGIKKQAIVDYDMTRSGLLTLKFRYPLPDLSDLALFNKEHLDIQVQCNSDLDVQ